MMGDIIVWLVNIVYNAKWEPWFFELYWSMSTWTLDGWSLFTNSPTPTCSNSQTDPGYSACSTFFLFSSCCYAFRPNPAGAGHWVVNWWFTAEREKNKMKRNHVHKQWDRVRSKIIQVRGRRRTCNPRLSYQIPDLLQQPSEIVKMHIITIWRRLVLA